MVGQVVAAGDQVAEQLEEAFGAALGRGAGVGGAVGAGDRSGQGLQDGVEQGAALGAELAAQWAAAVGGVGHREVLPVGLAGLFPFQGGPAVGVQGEDEVVAEPGQGGRVELAGLGHQVGLGLVAGGRVETAGQPVQADGGGGVAGDVPGGQCGGGVGHLGVQVPGQLDLGLGGAGVQPEPAAARPPSRGRRWRWRRRGRRPPG